MELTNLNSQTTWAEASGNINHNNGKINEAIMRLENSTYKNKGYFRSVESLNEYYPAPSNGSKAYVGESYPYAIYVVENGAWIDSGEFGGQDTINLENIYTKEDIIDLPQSLFDEMMKNGLLDPSKEYNTYED